MSDDSGKSCNRRLSIPLWIGSAIALAWVLIHNVSVDMTFHDCEAKAVLVLVAASLTLLALGMSLLGDRLTLRALLWIMAFVSILIFISVMRAWPEPLFVCPLCLLSPFIGSIFPLVTIGILYLGTKRLLSIQTSLQLVVGLTGIALLVYAYVNRFAALGMSGSVIFFVGFLMPATTLATVLPSLRGYKGIETFVSCALLSLASFISMSYGDRIVARLGLRTDAWMFWPGPEIDLLLGILSLVICLTITLYLRHQESPASSPS